MPGGCFLDDRGDITFDGWEGGQGLESRHGWIPGKQTTEAQFGTDDIMFEAMGLPDRPRQESHATDGRSTESQEGAWFEPGCIG